MLSLSRSSKRLKVCESGIEVISNDILVCILGMSFDTLREARNVMLTCRKWYDLRLRKQFWEKYFMKLISSKGHIHDKVKINIFHPFWWGKKCEIMSQTRLRKAVLAKVYGFVRVTGSYLEYDINDENVYILYCDGYDVYGKFSEKYSMYPRNDRFSGKNITWDQRIVTNSIDPISRNMMMIGEMQNSTFKTISYFRETNDLYIYEGDGVEIDNTIERCGNGVIKWVNGCLCEINDGYATYYDENGCKYYTNIDMKLFSDTLLFDNVHFFEKCIKPNIDAPTQNVYV